VAVPGSSGATTVGGCPAGVRSIAGCVCVFGLLLLTCSSD
jgi:hypothetical protein